MLDYTACGQAGDWELDSEGAVNKANLNAWPWLATVVREQHGYYCEGTLICEQWVIVAASCLNGNRRLNESAIVDNSKVYNFAVIQYF